ncbi:MAG: hypothetical protein K0U45_07900 [Alphaproteobacteria bacterium]|nr:hypothetical protein [Alphaproteobacteria bacterium]
MTIIKITEFDVYTESNAERYNPFSVFIKNFDGWKSKHSYQDTNFEINIQFIENEEDYIIGCVYKKTDDKTIAIMQEEKLRAIRLRDGEYFASVNFFTFNLKENMGFYSEYRGSLSFNQFVYLIIKAEYKKIMNKLLEATTLKKAEKKIIKQGIKKFLILKKIDESNIQNLLDTLTDIQSLNISFDGGVKEEAFGSGIKQTMESFSFTSEARRNQLISLKNNIVSYVAKQSFKKLSLQAIKKGEQQIRSHRLDNNYSILKSYKLDDVIDDIAQASKIEEVFLVKDIKKLLDSSNE